MGEQTAIAWTDHTFNPWMGCSKVSPGCDHCYAEALGKRSGKVQWGDDAERVVTSDAYWKNPFKWNAVAEAHGVRHRVFCASLSDVFENRDELVEPRARLWNLIASTPSLDWQLLTKRPQNALDLTPWTGPWPANIWIGTTVEDQERAEERIPHLLKIPAAVRFLSCEPLLGPVDLSLWLNLEWMDALRLPGAPLSFRGEGGWGCEMFATLAGERPSIDWVIVGGESGPGYRWMDIEHARDLRDQCLAAEVPFFFKQWGGRFPHSHGHLLDDVAYREFPTSAVLA